MSAEDNARLLAILEAHGQEFVNSFSLPAQVLGSKRKFDDISPTSPVEEEETSEEEWGGIQIDSEPEDDAESRSGEKPSPAVVVFADGKSMSNRNHDTRKPKSFMSARVSKIRQDSDIQEIPGDNSEEEDDDRSHTQNDALLHRLVHTQLLSASLNPELELSPAQRQKALAGRVLEISGGAKLGKGETRVRQDEIHKASKRVREGLLAKQQERRVAKLEESKNLGNYHPSMEHILKEPDHVSKRKRERGIGMGIGKFRRGTLGLNRLDLSRIQGTDTKGRGETGGRRGSSRR